MTRLYIALSFVCLAALVSFAPAQGNGIGAPPTNTPRYVPQVALIPSLTPAPCPAPQVYSFTDSAGVIWNVTMRAEC